MIRAEAMSGYAATNHSVLGAQQKAQIDAQYAQAAQGVSDHPLTVLEAAEQQAQRTTNSLAEIVSRLMCLKERAFGSDPEEASNAAGDPPVSGAVARLSRAIQPHDLLILRIQVLISELDRLA